MKIRNIVLLFILLLIGIIFYKIKEGLTIQEAERELNDLNEQLDNAVREKKFSQVYILQDKVSLAKKAYVKQVQKETKEINNQTPIQELNLKDLLELERKKGLESVKNAINNQKIEDKNKYDKYIEDNQGFFESLTNKAKQILSDQLNTISQLKKQAIDNNFIINDVPKKQVLDKTKDRYADPSCNKDEYVYCSGDKITCEDIFGNPLNQMTEKKYANGITYSGCGSAINSKSYSQFLDDMTTGVTVEGNQSVFYDISSCPSDKPWRVDIPAGDLSFNKNVMDVSSNLTNEKLKLKEKDDIYVDGDYLYKNYKNDIYFNSLQDNHRITVNRKTYYKGIVKEVKNNECDIYIPEYGKQVFYAINNKYLYKINKDISNNEPGVYVTENYQCYKSQVVASGISKFNDKKSQNLYINSDVYVDGDYLYDKYNKDSVFGSIRKQPKIWVNNKACYKGVIKNIRTNNNFDVSIPDNNGQVFYDISNKYLYTINLEYKNDLNSTLTDLKVGSLPRPVCKNGNFTKKCSNKIPNDIEFLQTPDKTAYSADAFPLLMSEGNEATCSNKLNFSPY